MFKILVADDEKFIRRGIISILQRGLKENIECIEAKNGYEALEQTKLETPNLIITDISMPGLNGLDFIKQLKDINNSTTVIILSGYENFDFARIAIKLGVKEYIMKPINKKEFLSTIECYVTDIENVKVRSNEEIIRNIENNKTLLQMKNDFLIGLLNCINSEESKNYLKKLKSYGMTFDSMLFVCAVVQYQVTSDNNDYLDFAVNNILEEFLNMEQDSCSVITVKYDLGKIVVIFEERDQKLLQESKKKLLRKAGKLIKEYYKTDVFIGLGDVAYDSIYLYKSLNHALEAVDFKIYNNGDNIEVYSEIMEGPDYDCIEMNKLLKPFNSVSAIRVANEFDKLMSEPKSVKAINTIRKTYCELQIEINKQISRLNYIECKPNLKNFNEFWNFSELKREVKDKIQLIQEMNENVDIDISNTKLLADIIQYIQNNITTELDLNTVADHFNRTPGYISSLFKKGNEYGFNAYITNERVKIAKKLLEDSTVPIQQVGDLCGYPNSKYFSVVFKKVTGENPRSYRQNH